MFRALQLQSKAVNAARFLRRSLLSAFVLSALAACETLQLPLQSPSVELAHIQPGQNPLLPSLRVGLLVKNPNARALNLQGLSYSVALQGFDVISGESNDIPSIPGRGEQIIEVDARLGFIEGVQLISMLIAKPERNLGFTLNAKLNTGLPLLGAIPVRRSGVLDLQTFTATMD